MKGVVQLIAALGYRGGISLLSRIPLSAVDSVGGRIGLFIGALIPSRRRIALEGISRSLDWMRSRPGWGGGDLTPSELVRKTLMNIGRSLVESAILHGGRGEPLLEGIRLVGEEHYRAARESGRGVMLLTGHCGNWELVALGFSRIMRTPMAVVARRQDNPHLNRMVEGLRRRYDNRIIYKEGALREILKSLARGEVVGILADQAVIPEEGVKIDFLGRPAWAAKSPVLIARRSNAAVIPAFTHREGGHHVITFLPELSFVDDDSEEGVRENVRRYSAAIEEFIVAHPTQWYWVHRRWKRA